MSDDGKDTEESLSRLKAIREQKKLEQFLSTIDVNLKPVIDTTKNRSVTDDVLFNMSATQHIERLTGKNAFVFLFLLRSRLVEESEPVPRADASRDRLRGGHPSALPEAHQHDPPRQVLPPWGARGVRGGACSERHAEGGDGSGA